MGQGQFFGLLVCPKGTLQLGAVFAEFVFVRLFLHQRGDDRVEAAQEVRPGVNLLTEVVDPGLREHRRCHRVGVGGSGRPLQLIHDPTGSPLVGSPLQARVEVGDASQKGRRQGVIEQDGNQDLRLVAPTVPAAPRSTQSSPGR